MIKALENRLYGYKRELRQLKKNKHNNDMFAIMDIENNIKEVQSRIDDIKMDNVKSMYQKVKSNIY
jgi:hypothetical protein